MMIYKFLRSFENMIDRAGWRGKLRSTPLYNYYKIIKALPMLLNWRMVNLYSREMFRKCLQKKDSDMDVYSHWLESFQERAEQPLNSLKDPNPLPWMYIKAVHFMEYHLLNRNNPVVFEWGGGTSTLWLSKLAKTVVTIESNAEWGDALSCEIKKRNIQNVELMVIEPETVTSQGYECKYISWWDDFCGQHFTSYVNAINVIYKIRKYDLILIDGECRIACLENALKHLKDDGLIVFDNSARERYKEMLFEIEKSKYVIRLIGPTTYGLGYDETMLILSKQK